MNKLKFYVFATLATVVLAAAPGCRSWNSRQGTVSDTPTISGLDAEDKAYLGTPSERMASVVDRHPLFYKPRDYWENSSDNRIVKAAAATFVGVPAGIVGEVRQLFVGRPATYVAPTTDINY